ncbi:MAG: glutamine amidotransferase [Alphaproteobacteria bacterium]
MTRTALAIRHVAFEDLGLLGSILASRGFGVRYVEAGADDLAGIDPLGPDLVVVLGGPIGVYEGDIYPFLANAIALLEQRLAADRPTLGICLGAQLMAAALGARVYPGNGKEIGWKPLALSTAGARSCLAELGDAAVLHWHGDTFDCPTGATHLASTDLYPNQAFAWRRNGLALQFHLEVVDPASFEHWLIGHAVELGRVSGLTVPGLRAATARNGPALRLRAMRTFTRWLAETGC